MALIDSIELTDEDRQRWRMMDNDGGRRAMKHVSAQPSSRLFDCVRYESNGNFDYRTTAFLTLLAEFGTRTNPSWLASRIAEMLYDRDDIDVQQFDRITEAL
jgi:hypothetical protein